VLLPELCQPPYNLSAAQVVAIASNDGGKQALEAVKVLLPELCQPPYNLSAAQVVAIASNDGGKQALEAVKVLLPELCPPPCNLSAGQVVAIASNIGGKQALEAVKALLPQLREPPYGLGTEQVVAIASNGGGKQALEAVKALLPQLREPPYGLSTEQVVAIASNGGGRQALEAVKVLLPELCQRPHGLSTGQAVALACIGGRPALETARHTQAPIRRMQISPASNPAPTPTRYGPTPAQCVEVLQFFHDYLPPRSSAFADAKAKFQVSRVDLLRLLASLGVTEAEALSGTLPDAGLRWQRLLNRLNLPPRADAAQPSSAGAMQGFAESLERSLESPSPVRNSALAHHAASTGPENAEGFDLGGSGTLEELSAAQLIAGFKQTEVAFDQ
ncbi:avirulence protein, partial [Paraburkholderia sp. CNPSo 3155]